MSKSALILGVCLSLSACMVYAPTYVEEKQNTVVHYESTSQSRVDQKQETVGVPERVRTKVVHKRNQRTLADCGTFTLPREAQKPTYLTDDELAQPADSIIFDTMIARKLKELQNHIDNLHSEYEQAHIKWMETCAKKLLN